MTKIDPDPFSPARARGAIELRSVTKRYGRERVVDSVAVKIEPGEFFSLLGPSGSGKTTTLLMIAGFADVDEGAIVVDGTDVAATPPQRRGFGMVFQNYAIFPHLDVFENVAFPLRARGVPDAEIAERVAAAPQLVRLERFAQRYSRALSGGQQQRVAIARAIVFQPSVVLMDEPLGALDKNLRYQMQVEIKEIQRRLGMTVVYVTHDQEEAMNMSDRIAIMNSGRIEQVGRPVDIYENPATSFIARFLGEANLIEGSVVAIDDGVATVRVGDALALRARAAQSVAAEGIAQVFVRPERIVLTDAAAASPVLDPGAWNVAGGRIAQTSFLGNILRYIVRIDGTEALATVDVQNASAAALLATGSAVRLAWRVGDSVLLTA
jgi:spermidine/putrescine ABC transporter ATP-binding subunit